MMGTKVDLEKLDNDFKDVVGRYSQAFVDMYFSSGDDVSPETWWVAAEFGGVLAVNDYFFSLDDIRFCVNNSVPWDTVSEWYDYCIRVGMLDSDIPVPNIKSWVGGCPRLSNKKLDSVERKKKEIDRLTEKYRDAIDEIRAEVGMVRTTK